MNERATDSQSEFELFQVINYFTNENIVNLDGIDAIESYDNFPNCLYEIHKFVKCISESTHLAFKVVRGANGKSEIKKLKFSSYFDQFNSFIDQCLIWTASPPSAYVQLFFDAVNAFSLEWEIFSRPGLICRESMLEADVFNSLIGWIREKSRTVEFKNKLYAERYSGSKNLRSATKFVDQLIARYSDLLIIRVDLSYRQEIAQSLDIQEVKADLKRLLNNRRQNKIFDHCVGYIVKLEYGPKKGLHFHAFFFFNGQKRQSGAWIADEICTYWMRDITDGRGLAHNCNKAKKTYWYWAIGMVHYLDVEKISHFKRFVLPYITHYDPLICCQYPGKGRLFFKGIVKEKQSTVGRKRHVLN